MLKFEEAEAKGAAGGELFYRMGFCYKTVREDLERSRAYYAKAQPLLENDLKDDKKATLDTYYYLTGASTSPSPTRSGPPRSRGRRLSPWTPERCRSPPAAMSTSSWGGSTMSPRGSGERGVDVRQGD